MNLKYKYQIKGNESFTIREGWLRKVLRYIPNDYSENQFRRVDATEVFGVGSNMVKSIRYWSTCSGLIEEERSGKRFHKKTHIGQIIDSYDPYFDDIFSLWLVHYHLASNEENATLWYLFFNEFNARTFTKDALHRELLSIFHSKSNERPSEKSFWDDCNSVIKTYCSDDIDQNPEDNYICPLVELGLIQHVEKGLYEKTTPSMQKLDKLMVLYAVCKQIERRESPANRSISLEEILYASRGAGKLLNLNRYRIFEYFEQLRNANFVTINRTAGLNMFYIHDGLTASSIIEKYYQIEK